MGSHCHKRTASQVKRQCWKGWLIRLIPWEAASVQVLWLIYLEINLKCSDQAEHWSCELGVVLFGDEDSDVVDALRKVGFGDLLIP